MHSLGLPCLVLWLAAYRLCTMLMGASIRLGIYLRHGRLLVEVVLLHSLQEPQVGSTVFDFSRTLVWRYLPLLAPPLHVGTSEETERTVLADELGVVGIQFQQMDDPCGNIIKERGVADALVGEIE